MPKISIIIPVYNQSEKLKKCLASVKAQTFVNYEVVVVNDGSTDLSGSDYKNLVNSYFEKAIVLNQKNSGAPAARNAGFRQSSGQYIIFCDADVVMRSNMLSVMFKELENNLNVSYVYSSHKFGFKTFKLWDFDVEKLKQMPYIHTTSLIRREHFPLWDESIKRLQDWDLWLTMLEMRYIGKWINQVLFSIDSGGTMSSWLPSFWVKLGIGKKSRQYKQAVEFIKEKHHLK